MTVAGFVWDVLAWMGIWHLYYTGKEAYLSEFWRKDDR